MKNTLRNVFGSLSVLALAGIAVCFVTLPADITVITFGMIAFRIIVGATVIAAIVATGAACVWLALSYRMQVRQRNEAKTDAREARATAFRMIMATKSAVQQQREFDIASNGLSPQLLTIRQCEFGDIRQQYRTAATQYAQLTFRPEVADGLQSVAEYRQMRDDYTRVAEQLDDVSSRFEQLIGTMKQQSVLYET